MPYLKSKTGNEEINLFYEDLGNDNPIVFVHAWPFTHQIWEYQLTPLRELGFRCIAYDRRGFGRSDQSLNNYNYDVLADDLKNLLDEINAASVTLVGYSMGGGDVVRYCTRYNCEKVSKLILVGSIVPYMLKTEDNPDGTPAEMFAEFDQQIRDDKAGFFTNFSKAFYGVGLLKHPVSEGILQWTNSLAFPASQKAVLGCMQSFSQTDFRKELSGIKVPTLVIHGDNDKIVPIKAAGEQAAKLIEGAVYKVYPGAPHGLIYTHRNILNRDIVSFITSSTVDENDVYEDGVDILPSNEPLIIRDGEQE
jgi:pimeloyl-ACP methyl ester carboxylesterase